MTSPLDTDTIAKHFATPVQPNALTLSISELNQLANSDVSELTPGQSESILLVIHELNRLLVAQETLSKERSIVLALVRCGFGHEPPSSAFVHQVKRLAAILPSDDAEKVMRNLQWHEDGRVKSNVEVVLSHSAQEPVAAKLDAIAESTELNRSEQTDPALEKIYLHMREAYRHAASIVRSAAVNASQSAQGELIALQEAWEAAGGKGTAPDKADVIATLQQMHIIVTESEQIPR